MPEMARVGVQIGKVTSGVLQEPPALMHPTSRAPGVLRQHGVVGCEGTVPHASETPPCATDGLAQAGALFLGSPHQGRLVIPPRESAQEPQFSWEGCRVEHRAASVPARIQHDQSHQGSSVGGFCGRMDGGARPQGR